MKKPKIFLVILNWNRADLTIDCLESINQLQPQKQIQVIAIDNASTDDSVEKIKNSRQFQDLGSKVKLIENKRNLGFAEGNNVGLKYGLEQGADYLLVLNNDTIVNRNLISELLSAAEKTENFGAASPKIYFARGFEFQQKRYSPKELGKVIWYAGGKIDWKNVYGQTRGVDEVDQGQFEEIEETDFATGTCLFLKASALKKVGLFNPNYFMYYEDTDLSLRLQRAGFKVIYVPKAIVYHKVAQSSAVGSELNDYFTTRNRMLFGLKYAHCWTKLALIRESLKLLVKGRKWQKIGIRDYYLGRFNRGSWEDKTG